MIANNSAGARSIAYGLTADHVLSLDVTLADGTRATLRRGGPAPPALEAARAAGGGLRAPPALLRRVSGYALDALAGDEPDWPRLVCGSEGTLAVIRGAELRLVERPAGARAGADVVRLGGRGARGASRALEAGPSAVELMARRGARTPTPRPSCWWSTAASRTRWRRPCGRCPGARVVLDARRAGGGLGRAAGGDRPRPRRAARRARATRSRSPFIEDPAVPPERLPELARGIRRILDARGHCRPSGTATPASGACTSGRGWTCGCRARRRRCAGSPRRPPTWWWRSAGSLSGEHGDGRARSRAAAADVPAGDDRRLRPPEGPARPRAGC